ncbi:MAG: hypothetical protein FJX76_07310 [Armatimonadetes bacterium]|nr:hypothetical protein [Armatimonadota bacterium]
MTRRIALIMLLVLTLTLGAAWAATCSSCTGSGKCTGCYGTGYLPGYGDECYSCEGSGQCANCEGSGEVDGTPGLSGARHK